MIRSTSLSISLTSILKIIVSSSQLLTDYSLNVYHYTFIDMMFIKKKRVLLRILTTCGGCMKPFLILALMCFSATIVAQTATPTVAPPVGESIIAFNTISAPQAQISNSAVITVLGVSTLGLLTGGSVRFTVDGKFVTIWAARTSTSGTMQVCVNTTCSTVTPMTTGYTPYGFMTTPGDQITISAVSVPSGQAVSLWQLAVLQGNIIAAPTQTPGPTPTVLVPTPFLVFVPYIATAEATGSPRVSMWYEVTETPDGEVGLRVDAVVTTADVVITTLLVLMLLVMLVGVVISWSRS